MGSNGPDSAPSHGLADGRTISIPMERSSTLASRSMVAMSQHVGAQQTAPFCRPEQIGRRYTAPQRHTHPHTHTHARTHTHTGGRPTLDWSAFRPLWRHITRSGARPPARARFRRFREPCALRAHCQWHSQARPPGDKARRRSAALRSADPRRRRGH
jgi:hypothetical protein